MCRRGASLQVAHSCTTRTMPTRFVGGSEPRALAGLLAEPRPFRSSVRADGDSLPAAKRPVITMSCVTKSQFSAPGQRAVRSTATPKIRHSMRCLDSVALLRRLELRQAA
jgi:hypothetical protein